MAIDGLVGGVVYNAHHISAAELHLLHLGLCLCAAVEHFLIASVFFAAERGFETGESHGLAPSLDLRVIPVHAEISAIFTNDNITIANVNDKNFCKVFIVRNFYNYRLKEYQYILYVINY